MQGVDADQAQYNHKHQEAHAHHNDEGRGARDHCGEREVMGLEAGNGGQRCLGVPRVAAVSSPNLSQQRTRLNVSHPGLLHLHLSQGPLGRG